MGYLNKKVIIYDYKFDSKSCFFSEIKSRLILDWFIELIDKFQFEEVILCTEEVERTKQLLADRPKGGTRIQILNSISAPGDVLILKANCIYDLRRLKKLIKKGSSDFSRVILWEIRDKVDIENAEAVIERIEKYPIARYINLRLGKRLALFLKDSAVHPNQLTYISLVAGILACFCFGLGNYILFLWGSLLLQLHCTLDFADGHLARLQGRVSKRGALLDGIVNKIVEVLCYMAISYNLFIKSNNSLFLIIGMLVILGYFMISYIVFLKKEYLGSSLSESPLYQIKEEILLFKIAKKIYWFFEAWDVHLYIICFFAILNSLKIPLIYFAIDFNIRWIFNACKIILMRKNL